MSGYLELKLSWELYKRPPQQLEAAESALLGVTAERQRLLEVRILSSAEAARALVTPSAIAERMAQIRGRYQDEASFEADLRQIDLDISGLEAEIARDLRIEGTLDHVTSSMPPVTDVDAEIFYQVHGGRFTRPERRTARHILITFPDAAGKQEALTLLDELRARITNADDFGKLAMRHSHCPTALEGGVLGALPRGKLYQELDTALFALPEGELSAPIETTVGLHLLRCDEIHPPATPAFTEVRQRIVDALNESRRKATIKAWINAQAQGADATAGRV